MTMMFLAGTACYAASINGKVVDAFDNPLAGVKITCRKWLDRSNMPDPKQVLTGEDGTFAIDTGEVARTICDFEKSGYEKLSVWLNVAGVISKSSIEVAKLNWDDIRKKLTENGLAKLLDEWDFQLILNLEQEKDRMKKIFGDDFSKNFTSPGTVFS